MSFHCFRYQYIAISESSRAGHPTNLSTYRGTSAAGKDAAASCVGQERQRHRQLRVQRKEQASTQTRIWMTKSFDGCLPAVPTWWINANFGRVLERFKDQTALWAKSVFTYLVSHIIVISRPTSKLQTRAGFRRGGSLNGRYHARC